MKIILINPYDSTYRYRSGIFKKSLMYAPLTLTTLAALVPKEISTDIRIIDEGVEELDENIKADLIGISVVTASSPRAYALADKFRSQGKTVVLGGVHTSLLPQEAGQHADSVVLGFAEETWPELLKDFQKSKLKKLYTAADNLELKALPMPRRDLLNKNRYLTIHTIQASRGCPHSCKFCVIPQVWGNRYYHRPIEDVVAEIKLMNKKEYLFLDPSPIEDREYIKSLYQALIPLNIKWAGLATIKIGQDDKLLNLAVKSGCKGVLIGFESIFQNCIDSADKHFNKVSEYRDVVAKLHDNGIAVLGCFLFGFDNEDDTVFERTVSFVNSVKIDIVRYAVYTPFPGTAIYSELNKAGRIIVHDWGKYDNEHVVFQPARMSPEELQAGLSEAWQETYTLNSMFRRLIGLKNLSWITVLANFGFRYYGDRIGRTMGGS